MSRSFRKKIFTSSQTKEYLLIVMSRNQRECGLLNNMQICSLRVFHQWNRLEGYSQYQQSLVLKRCSSCINSSIPTYLSKAWTHFMMASTLFLSSKVLQSYKHQGLTEQSFAKFSSKTPWSWVIGGAFNHHNFKQSKPNNHSDVLPAAFHSKKLSYKNTNLQNVKTLPPHVQQTLHMNETYLTARCLNLPSWSLQKRFFAIRRKDHKFPELKAEDLEEEFVRGSGPGGQSVNKTSNCVVLKHLPTGTVVKCHETRSLDENRKRARLRLEEKLDLDFNGDQSYISRLKAEGEEAKREKKRRNSRRLALKSAFKEREGLD